MNADEIITIILYVLMGVASIVSAVVSYIKTGKFTTDNTASNADVIATLRDVKDELYELRSSNEALFLKLDSLDKRVTALENASQNVERELDDFSRPIVHYNEGE